MTGRPVLVVEDDPEIRAIACEVLAAQGLAALGVGSLGEALRTIEHGLRPSVAVIDAQLPDGSGVAFCRRLKAADPALRCLLFSSEADLPALARAAQADTFLPKPAVLRLPEQVATLIARL